jgi:Pyrimidine dimer DNA glycosylase
VLCNENVWVFHRKNYVVLTLGEHRELHATWSILTNNKKGYSKHPETLRWSGKLKPLYLRHQKLVKEMGKRGYEHHSPLSKELAKGSSKQRNYINSYQEQIEILKTKNCSYSL